MSQKEDFTTVAIRAEETETTIPIPDTQEAEITARNHTRKMPKRPPRPPYTKEAKKPIPNPYTEVAKTPIPTPYTAVAKTPTPTPDAEEV